LLLVVAAVDITLVLEAVLVDIELVLLLLHPL
jgi:hypothetical protein